MVDNGNDLGLFSRLTYTECIGKCNEQEGCQSLVFYSSRLEEQDKNNCFLKDKTLDGTETLNTQNDDIFSAYKTCPIGNDVVFYYIFQVLLNI